MQNDEVWPTFSRLGPDGLYQVFVIAPDGSEHLIGTAKPTEAPPWLKAPIVGQHFTMPPV